MVVSRLTFNCTGESRDAAKQLGLLKKEAGLTKVILGSQENVQLCYTHGACMVIRGSIYRSALLNL